MFDQRKLVSLVALFLLIGMSLSCGSNYGGGSYLTGITIAPISPSIAVGATQLFTATGHFSNGPNQDLTHQASWTSSVTTVATIAGTGTQPSLATGVAQGQTQITVSFAQGSSNVQASTNLTVTP
jgi:uncharacterized protein YjdB